jgi:hypothetical protein
MVTKRDAAADKAMLGAWEKARAVLAVKWKKYDDETRDDAIAKAWESLNKGGAAIADVCAKLASAAHKRMLAYNRDKSRRRDLLGTQAEIGAAALPDSREKRERLARGLGRLPSGRLYRKGPGDTPERPVILSEPGEPGSHDDVAMTGAHRYAADSIAWFVSRFGGDPTTTHVSRADEQKLAEAYLSIFNHDFADAEDVHTTERLIRAVEFCHETDGAEWMERGAVIAVRRAGAQAGATWPAWLTDDAIESLYRESALNPGGRGNASKTVGAVVLALVNAHRKADGRRRWPSLASVGIHIGSARLANSRPKRR